MTGSAGARRVFRRSSPKPRAPFTLLITGGSQGSRTLNQAARESWPLFRGRRMPDAHRAPERDAAKYRSLARRIRQLRVWKEKSFRSSATCRRRFAAADLVVVPLRRGQRRRNGGGRQAVDSGAVSVRGRRSSAHNAEAMVDAGGGAHGARRGDDRRTTVRVKWKTLRKRSGDAARMRQRVRAFARPGAAERAADVLEEAAAEKNERTLR